MQKTNLQCIDCGRVFSSDNAVIVCDDCHGTLEVEYVKDAKINTDSRFAPILERYKEFYPYFDDNTDLSLGEGFTSLPSFPELAESLGIKKFYFKNETQNPTWSFKDRGTLSGILHAISLGYKRIGTVSTGNMAVSVAAYGAKLGLDTYVLVNSNIAAEKLNPIAIYNPHLIKVEGDYGDLYKKSLEVGKNNDIYFINSDVPFRVEGYKTLAYEVCEQLDFDIPDYVVVPTSAGGNLRGIVKGFEEFKQCGIIDKIPTFVCAQSAGCSPIVKAAEEGNETIIRFKNPSTIAHAIENPLPPSGNAVLKKLRSLDGLFIAVTEDEIIFAQSDIAKQGLFVQPASAVSLAAVKKLKEQDKLRGTDSIVCVLTGSGLKYTAAFEKHDLNSHQCKIEDLESFVKDNFLEV